MFINRGLTLGMGAMAISEMAYPSNNFKNILTDLGFSTNLQLCLDAGDISSYDGDGDRWYDTSGNGYDFFLGSGSGADGADPTFNGTPGMCSSAEYWSFDGGDYFTYDTTNETWMQNIHKNNAAFTMCAWVQMGALGAVAGVCGTRGALANTGFTLYKGSTNLWSLNVQNAGADVKSAGNPAAMAEDTWQFVGYRLDETDGTSGSTSLVDESPSGGSGTYTSPATADASFTMQIGARGNADNPLPATSRMGMFAMWEGTALNLSDLDEIYAATRTRYGV